MQSVLVEFNSKQDMHDTLNRMGLSDIIVAPDNELLVQIFVTKEQRWELINLDCLRFIDDM